ncbi:hypothetical protein [Armatimonas sp.]|uniref:hypothetical protein n=1 Tax=Armatimonas sp. TaxID=1872638 RepID=UPI00286D12F4|nr:hypothetical protein [Armatimonas sp.]
MKNQRITLRSVVGVLGGFIGATIIALQFISDSQSSSNNSGFITIPFISLLFFPLEAIRVALPGTLISLLLFDILTKNLPNKIVKFIRDVVLYSIAAVFISLIAFGLKMSF